MRQNCPSADELSAFHFGTLAENRIDDIADHLEQCAQCEVALRRLDASVDKALAAVRLSASVVADGSKSGAILAAESCGHDVGLTAPENWPKLPGYEIVAVIGHGGTGAVYRARQLRPGREVALKRVRAGRGRDLSRSRAEADTLARLRHPNIVQIYEVIEHDGEMYLSLELIEGGSLAGYLQGRPLRQADVTALLETIARAVEHAHRHGVIHRDLKPANILLHQHERRAPRLNVAKRLITTSLQSPASLVPKVADFGIAKRLTLDTGETLEGDIIGTPSYMAPEQAAGKLDQIGPATDVYSLGVILYEMLTGRVPIQGPTTLETLSLVRTEEPVPPRRLQPSLSRDLEVICLKCLEKLPSRRYASAEDFADDLRRFRYDQPIRARAPSALDRSLRFARRNKSLIAAVSGVVVSLAAGLAFALFFAAGESRQRRLAEENARTASHERQLALREVYRGRIAAAAAALLGHDVAEAALQLNAAPEELRDWEWHHFHCALDESSAVFHSATDEAVHLFTPANDIRLLYRGPDTFGIGDATGKRLGTYSISARDALCLGRGPGDSRFARFEVDGTTIVDGDGKVLLRLPASDGVVCSADGKTLALRILGPAEHDRFVIFDLASGRERMSIQVPGQQLYSAAFSPDGKLVAAACEDSTARIWDTTTGQETVVLRGHAVKVVRVAFRPDGKRLATCSADGTVRQWDPESGREVVAPYERHVGEVWVAAFSPDGRLIASAGTDRTIRLWDAASRRDVMVRHGHTDSIEELAFSADGRRLASWSSDGSVRIWDVDESCSPSVLRGHGSYVYPVAFSPDGRWLASGSWDGTVRLWDARTGAVRRVWRHPSRVIDVAFTPGGQVASICGEDGIVRLWNVDSESVARKIKVAETPRWHLAVTSDGSRIITSEATGPVTVTDAATGSRVDVLRPGGPSKLACSPDGRLLAVGDAKGHVTVWSLPELNKQVEFAGHTAPVVALAFSHDGRQLVSAGYDRTVRVWDLDSRQCRMTLKGQSGDIFAVAIHPDGRRIASAGRDGMIWLWDVTTASEVARLRGHTNSVWSLAFSPDGKTLASGSGNGTVRLWDTEPVANRYRALHAERSNTRDSGEK